MQVIIDFAKRLGLQRTRQWARATEARYLAVEAQAWDRYYNISTHVIDIAPAFGDDKGYDPISYRGLHYLRRRLALRPDDVLMDIGCGRARPNCVFARRTFALSSGVEFLRAHARVATQNALQMRGKRTPIHIVWGDAAEQDYIGVTLFFVFNPFGPQTMRHVLARIGQSLQDHPRTIRLLYANPVHADIVAEQPWLHPVEHFKIPHRVGWSLPATLYSNQG